MLFYFRNCAAALLLGLPGMATAATTFFVADGMWPTDLTLLRGERAAWANFYGGSVSTEDFNDPATTLAPPVVYDDFVLTRDQTGPFLVRQPVEPLQSEGYSMTVRLEDVIYFDFFQPINAFAIDWANFDRPATMIDYTDNAGNEMIDLFQPVISGVTNASGGGFFGIFSDTSFSSLKFTLNSNEQLNFDYVQYGSLISSVPTPAAGALLLSGLGAFAFLRRRRTA